MKASELREQTLEELSRKLGDFEEQLFKLRFQRSTGQIEDPNKIREARKNIARVLTVINERKSAGIKASGITAAQTAGSPPAKGSAPSGPETAGQESETAQENEQ